ncbi:hypothetical protein GCM10009835_30160 [Planosporangium flavigriseum]
MLRAYIGAPDAQIMYGCRHERAARTAVVRRHGVPEDGSPSRALDLVLIGRPLYEVAAALVFVDGDLVHERA